MARLLAALGACLLLAAAAPRVRAAGDEPFESAVAAGGGAPAADPFAAATAGGALSGEERAVLDGFAPESAAPDPFVDGGGGGEFGLAPQFNASGGGNGTRLRYAGAATTSYAAEPLPTNFGAVDLGCGFGYVSDPFLANYVGVGPAFYQKAFSCGRCMKIQCDDVSCEEPGRTLVAAVVDFCGPCFDADMNMAAPLFAALSGRGGGVNPQLAVSWEWTDCSLFINTTIKMLVKPGGTAYFQSFNFGNSRQVITAAQINGQRLKHESNNFWSWSPTQGAIDPRGPFEFALLGETRQVLRVRVGQLRSQDLAVQFAAPPGVFPTAPAAADAAAAAGAPAGEPTPEPAAAAAVAPAGKAPAAPAAAPGAKDPAINEAPAAAAVAPLPKTAAAAP